MVSDRDRHFMERCLSLAQQAQGHTAPNPLVGSVIVQNDQILGEGFHRAAGQPHAEIMALADLGDKAWDPHQASLYVNLEPCNHYGRTPPCTEAILKAGIRRVVVGMVDPDPRVSGRGIDRLRAAGVDVVVGVEQNACEQLNEAFIHRVTQQRPFGIWKYAMTLDGKIAASTGHSAWVTGPQARHQVHHLRSQCEAVIVGGNTVRRDNPHLTTHGVRPRDQPAREPRRVVMSASLDLPQEAHLWHTQEAPTLIYTSQAAWQHQSTIAPGLLEQWQRQGVEVIPLENLRPSPVMADLYDRGCMAVLWECGGTLAAAALGEGCVQKIWAFIAPKLVGGGAQAPSALGDLGIGRMDEAIVLNTHAIRWIGPDLLWESYVQRPGSGAP